MFQRRHKLPLRRKVAGILWPRMGWRRALTYYWHRLHRIQGTSAFIARGFACGAALAMTPFYGTHMLLGAGLAWVLGGSMLAAMIGAQVANPWTTPPLWYAAYYLGVLMLGQPIAHHEPNFVGMFTDLVGAVFNLDGALFMSGVWPVLWPMTVGSIPLGIIVGITSYFALESVLGVVHAKRSRRVRESH